MNIFDQVGPVEQDVTITYPRPWRERLFARPWRPLHNIKVCTFVGTVERAGYDSDDDLVIRPRGAITIRTARQR